MEDPLYNEAVALALKHKRPAARFIRQKLSIGSIRANKIMEAMKSNGIVSELKNTGFSGNGGYREIIQQPV